ncbi:protochlorophyllide-dependent translocon component 52 [Citrus sinensis]|uniref:Protochlorophyllide-dependent translocon component 52 n=3 Tax=Citrus TaxID=2706 RepID=A0ACB8MVH5_CITSI|nr:protochlorophyllide-dependent translocon component 52, chloroplastic [Citrus x clementina]XP_006488911.1 protochlorophyllide-dependent translocon component 52, chloroplastic isoform X1 [Citrus sinensis]XP_052291162.1 protochlorophyllide-dependent translocon component 52, chloroplastic isoform X1 [Citrus sinensis]ESR58873.1 hypothetical protein CICLE_v10014836mg [Citrus x clementina]KAH9740624.1 protochlorophyllide-dependent translocon component 52 [Citrus sinensis]KAH9789145.1 protochloroph
MEALLLSSVSPFYNTPLKLKYNRTHFTAKPKLLSFHFSPLSTLSSFSSKPSKLFTTLSPSSQVSTEATDPPETEPETNSQEEKFDWFSQWYPLMPVCDLDKRVPHAKKVLGLDVVVWWDRNENEWRVFADACPHRLAPLSEGRIDQWGRLQCPYHGWCFSGSGDCKFIPQAPPDGPPVHTSKKACAAVYPSAVQNGILWFWPDIAPQCKDIIKTKKPPHIPELDDPSFTKMFGSRDVPYGYEVLMENLMDPAHLTYAHYGMMRTRKPKVMLDREGGRPIKISFEKIDINGFIAKQDSESAKFLAPCVFVVYFDLLENQENGSASSGGAEEKLKQRRVAMIFICAPVSPGNSRVIWAFPRNFQIWIDKVVPRWIFHIGQNLILDSDLCLLHVEERKIMAVGPANWQKACFVPTKSDNLVVGFRMWLKKYSGGQFNWGGKFDATLPPTLPREQLMDRYWSHVVNCKSCNAAHKSLNALEVILQVVSVVSVGIVAATKQNAMSMATRATIVSFAVICFAASKWLSHFVYKTFHYHDYNHALR